VVAVPLAEEELAPKIGRVLARIDPE